VPDADDDGGAVVGVGAAVVGVVDGGWAVVGGADGDVVGLPAGALPADWGGGALLDALLMLGPHAATSTASAGRNQSPRRRRAHLDARRLEPCWDRPRLRIPAVLGYHGE
jgi:hypothetical protein